jgi:hypothetical protein
VLLELQEQFPRLMQTMMVLQQTKKLLQQEVTQLTGDLLTIDRYMLQI